MPITIVVTTDPWSSLGKIPELCKAARDHIRDTAIGLVQEENSTPATVEAGIRKEVKLWAAQNVITSMVVKDLTVYSYSSDDGDTKTWGTQAEKKKIYTKSGILHISDPYAGYSTTYYGRRAYYGLGALDDPYDYNDTEQETFRAPAWRQAKTRYDDMTEEEIFNLYYKDATLNLI